MSEQPKRISLGTHHGTTWLMEHPEDGLPMFYGLHEDPMEIHLSMFPALMEYLAREETSS